MTSLQILNFLKQYECTRVYKTIKKSNYNLTDEKIQIFINSYEPIIKQICDSISKLRYINILNNNQIDQITFNELYPVMRNYYSPSYTKSDGNCMFNMISISLIGNDTLSKLLRSVCIYTILKYKNEFLNLIHYEESLNENYHNNSLTNKYNTILCEAKTNKCWCNEYHLLAISTFLNSDIYINSTFFNNASGQLYQPANTPDQLLSIFNSGSRTGAHLLYRPITNSSITSRNSQPIFGYFSSIPHSQDSLIFKPKNSIVSESKIFK